MNAMSLAALSLLTALPALQPDAAKAKQEKIAALKQSMAQNQAALKQYTWTETTQISLKGEVKKTEQKQCQYGPDGKVQKTAIPGAPPPQQEQSGGRRRKGGAVKEAVVENKVEDMKEYMQKVGALVHEYVPPDPQKIQAAAAAGKISITPAGGVDSIVIKDYLKPGDQVTLGFNSGAKKLQSYKVQSFLEKPGEDNVSLDVSFAPLPDGTNHVQQTVLDAPAKKIQVQVSNSGYKKAGA